MKSYSEMTKKEKTAARIAMSAEVNAGVPIAAVASRRGVSVELVKIAVRAWPYARRPLEGDRDERP